MASQLLHGRDVRKSTTAKCLAESISVMGQEYYDECGHKATAFADDAELDAYLADLQTPPDTDSERAEDSAQIV